MWAYDFVFDTCANAQQLKCLTVIDEWTRECLAIDVAGGIRSGRVIEVLAQLVSVHGAPRYLRSDNGPEFVACAILRWLHEAGIETALIDPGKPWQNGADESFNGKLRDEHLTLQWFRNRVDAKVGIEQIEKDLHLLDDGVVAACVEECAPVASGSFQVVLAAGRVGEHAVDVDDRDGPGLHRAVAPRPVVGCLPHSSSVAACAR